MRHLDPVRVYLFAQAGDGFAMSLIITLNLVYQVTVVGLDPLQLVLVGTTVEISYFLFEIPTGIVADVYSRKWSVVIGFVLIGLGFVIEGSIPEFGAVLVSAVLFGVGATFTSGAYEAWVASETAPSRASAKVGLGEIYLRGEQVHLGAALVAVAAAVFLGHEDVAQPIIVGGVLLIALGLILSIVMPEANFTRVPSRRRETWGRFAQSLRTSYRVVRNKRSLWLVVILMFLWGGAAEGYDRLWTIHLIEGYSLPAIAGVGLVGWFGIIRAGGMVLSILGAGLARRRIDTDSDNALARSMFGLALLIGLALAGLAFAPTFLVGALAVWVVAGARNVLHPLITTWVNRHSEEAVRATVLSGVRQAASFGELSVGPGLGWIARVMSVTAALAGSSMLIGTSLVGWARLTIPRKEKV